MPIMDNFPRKMPIASEDHDGLMSKDDKKLLKGLDDKKNSLMQVTGRKVHTFDTINSMVAATNLVANETVFVLGNESVLDDGIVRVYLTSTDSTPIGNGAVVQLIYSNLYAKLVLSIGDSSDINAAMASVITELESADASVKARVTNILNNISADSPTEVVDARLDEKGVAYACLKDRLDALGEKVSNAAIKRYGVRFTGSSSIGTRLDDAVNMVAEASTDSVKGTNDFDSVYPWSHMIRCNGYYTELGSFVVTAYEGEPGFTLNGSNGNVWVEIPVFYIKEDINTNYEDMYICGSRLDGYRLPEKFIKSNGTTLEKVYISAFSLSEEGSISGVRPLEGNYNTLLEKCTTIGDNHCGYTADDYELIRFLFTVEYATRNSQSIMTGAASLNTGESVTAVVGTTNGNSIIVKRSTDSLKFAIEQTCSIFTNADIPVVTNRTITAIERCTSDGSISENGDCLKISFNGEYINIAAGCYIISDPWKTGYTNSVLGPSGSPVSNTLGIYPCRYRYIENPWGNQWCILYQVRCIDKKIEYSKDIDGDYIGMKYDCPTETGYISSLGFDPKAPSCRFANSIIGGSSSTFYNDNFLASPDNYEKQVAVGGAISTGITSVGLYALNVSKGKDSNTKFGTRLSYNH